MMQSKSRDVFNYPSPVASAVEDTPEHVRMTNLLQSLKNNTPYLWIFQAPVNPVLLGMPNYFDVVKTPMDFDTIEKKKSGGEYASFDAFVFDVTLTFRNAIAYNSGNEVAVAARFMLQFVEAELTKDLAVNFAKTNVELEEIIDLTTIDLENLFEEERDKDRALLESCQSELANARKALDEVDIFPVDAEEVCGNERTLSSKEKIYELEKMLFGGLQDLGGSGSILDVSRRVLVRHKNKLTHDDDFNSDWSYNLRWAATSLRKKNVLVNNKKGSHWELNPGAVFESAKAEAATEDPCFDLRRKLEKVEAELAEETGKREKADAQLAELLAPYPHPDYYCRTMTCTPRPNLAYEVHKRKDAEERLDRVQKDFDEEKEKLEAADLELSEERANHNKTRAHVDEETRKRKQAEEDLVGERERAKAVTRLAYARLTTP